MVKPLVPKDYYANVYAAAGRNNYMVGRQGSAIDKIVVHVTQGSWQSAYNWVQNPAAGVSYHYLIAGNGYASQHVSEASTAYHAGNWAFNKTSVGIEHAGFISDPSMWTEDMYRSSAKIAAGIIHRAPRIPNDRFGYHLWGHDKVPGSTHTDPGRHFNWTKYMELIADFLGGEKPPAKTPSNTVFRVIAGSFGERENADRRAVQLKANGFGAPWIYKADGNWRVQVASFSDRKSAEESVAALEAKGFDAFLLAERPKAKSPHEPGKEEPELNMLDMPVTGRHGWDPHAEQLATYVERRWGVWAHSAHAGYLPQQADTAIDFWGGPDFEPLDLATGNEITQFLAANPDGTCLWYMMWQDRQHWYEEGYWRPQTPPFLGTGDIHHRKHTHLTLWDWQGAQFGRVRG